MPLYPYPHLVKVPGNKEGDDWIITDPHGSLALVEKIVDDLLLEKNNRLFICGDYVDRGEESFKLLQYLENKIGAPIFLIRGNHEDMLLRTIAFLDFYEEMHPTFAAQSLEIIKQSSIGHLNYHGFSFKDSFEFYETSTSLIALFKKAKKNNRSVRGAQWRSVYDSMSCDSKLYNLLYAFCRHMECDGTYWVLDLNVQERASIKEFIEKLPYIIHVEAAQKKFKKIKAFDIVHAAPLSDAIMAEKLKEIELTPTAQEVYFRVNFFRQHESYLAEDQIKYVTWARPEEVVVTGDLTMSSSGRSLESNRCYAGHTTFSADSAVCQEINLFILDVATTSTHCMLRVNHTQNTIIEETVNDDIFFLGKDAEKKDTCSNELSRLCELFPSYEYNIEEHYKKIYQAAGGDGVQLKNAKQLTLFRSNFCDCVKQTMHAWTNDEREAFALYLQQETSGFLNATSAFSCFMFFGACFYRQLQEDMTQKLTNDLLNPPPCGLPKKNYQSKFY
ncbi:MAG: metallophosphoesterase [Pseudomonadota bacterium]